MPVCSLLSPLLSLMIFIGGTLYELRRVSGCISIKEWVKCQLDDQYDEDRGWILNLLSIVKRLTTTPQLDILCMEELIRLVILLGLAGRIIMTGNKKTMVGK